MATVPRYDSLQVAPNTMAPTGVNTGVISTEAAAIPGRQMEQIGRGMQSAGEAGAQIATDMQQQANQIRVDDALNRAKETALRLTYDKDTGYTSQKGINALERQGGKPLSEEYGQTLQSEISKIAGSLGNDAQRAAFSQHANGMVTAFKGQATAHEAQEFKTYSLSVSEGIQSTAIREIGVRWNDPAAVDAATKRIEAETYRQAQLLGKSAEWQEATARKMVSNGHKVALLSALEQNDPAYADAYLKKYSGKMDADDILAVRGHITKDMDGRVAMGAATAAVGKFTTRMAPSDGDRAFNILIGAESGGRQFGKDGLPLTSGAGAIGIAQVMPATAPEAAKLAGVEWDENRYKTDANYNKALGLAYFQKQLQTNGGDLAKSYAAYNAGPGALQNAVKKADQSVKLNKTDPSVPVRSWIEFMPAETRAYVTKNMAAFDAGSGTTARPTFQDIDDTLRQQPELANNPHRYTLARQEAERQFNEQTKAIKQREEEAVSGAIRWGMQNGYRFSAMPSSMLAAIPADKLDSVRNTMASLSKGDNTDNPAAYQRLASNPGLMAKMGEAEWFNYSVANFSQDTKKHLDNERAKLTGGAPGGGGAGDLNSSAIKSALDSRLRMLGIDPTPKDDGGKDAALMGARRQFVDTYFANAQKEAGKKFSDEEVARHIDVLFAKNATFQGLFSNSSGPMLGMKPGDIDSSTKDKIRASFKRQGIDDPTDAQILNAYWVGKTTKIATK